MYLPDTSLHGCLMSYSLRCSNSTYLGKSLKVKDTENIMLHSLQFADFSISVHFST